MFEELRSKNKIVGVKQCKKALDALSVKTIYVAEDADERVIREIRDECIRGNIEIINVGTMKELGRACGIDVGAAVACILK